MSAVLSMPDNLDAERFILGSILLDDGHFANSGINPRAF